MPTDNGSIPRDQSAGPDASGCGTTFIAPQPPDTSSLTRLTDVPTPTTTAPASPRESG